MTVLQSTDLSPEDAQTAGFSKFNNGTHSCIVLDPAEHHTISVKAGSRRITFAFIPGKPGEFECVDVAMLDEGEGLRCIAFTRGSDRFRSEAKDEVSICAILLRKEN